MPSAEEAPELRPRDPRAATGTAASNPAVYCPMRAAWTTSCPVTRARRLGKPGSGLAKEVNQRNADRLPTRWASGDRRAARAKELPVSRSFATREVEDWKLFLKS